MSDEPVPNLEAALAIAQERIRKLEAALAEAQGTLYDNGHYEAAEAALRALNDP